MSDERTIPVWKALSRENGLQARAYPDAPRTDVYRLFGNAPARVLDVGCARGGVARGLRRRFPGIWVWGCELDPEASRAARGSLDELSCRPLEEWGDAERSLLSTVDTVLLLDVLEHMYNPWQFLQSLCEGISEKAQVIVSLPNAGNLDLISDLASGYFNYKETGILDVTHIRFFTRFEMIRMFYQTGFRVEQHAVLSESFPDKDLVFPVDVERVGIRIRVKSRAHWNSLRAIQFGFRLRKCTEESLTGRERTIRFAPHPPTRVF